MLRYGRRSVGMCVASVVLALSGLSGNAIPVQGQTIEGQVADGESYEVIEGVALTLMHPDGHDLGEPVESSASGRFALPLPGPGSYYLRAEKLGYTSIVEGVFDFTATSGSLQVEVYLRQQPVELEGVDVAVERVQWRRSLRAQGYYERLANGFGDFVTPEDIEARGVLGRPSELVQMIPGVSRLESLILFRAQSPPFSRAGGSCDGSGNRRGTPTSSALQMCKGGTIVDLGLCEPDLWVDGIRMIKANSNGFLDSSDLQKGVDALMNPQDILAMEIYRGIAGTPLRWAGLGATCGTIVIWTKQGKGG